MGPTAYVICGRPVLWDDLEKLPTDPDALRARLVGKDTGESAAEGLFNGVEELLARSPAEPRLRAALFKVLTGIPGARVTERVKDSTGRAGTAVDLDAGTWRLRLIIDTGAFHVLETVTTARNDGLSWGDAAAPGRGSPPPHHLPLRRARLGGAEAVPADVAAPPLGRTLSSAGGPCILRLRKH
ncbi:hypothetical protein GCM10020000_53330 [Streptomyces olivoverticillatus]